MNSNDFERARAGYDDAHEEALVEAITRAVFAASVIGEPPVTVLRTGELTNALRTGVATAIALSPSAVRSPAAIRKTTNSLWRRLLKRVAAARANADFGDFESNCFRHDDSERGGHA